MENNFFSVDFLFSSHDVVPQVNGNHQNHMKKIIILALFC